MGREVGGGGLRADISLKMASNMQRVGCAWPHSQLCVATQPAVRGNTAFKFNTSCSEISTCADIRF